jgi:MoxR-vWA-beta-propeller ternary system domain bpX4
VTPLTDFLRRLVGQGSVVLRERPASHPSERIEAMTWLESVYTEYRLDVAGPLLPFDPAIAVAAAECCRWACWFLVDRRAENAEVAAAVKLPIPSGDAAQHLSADLVLRFLPQIYHRARTVAVDDVLTQALAAICRQWPLSGVLADLDEAPTMPLDFGGHRGLQLLFAERFVEHRRPSWMPAGATLEHVNLVLSERGEFL